MENIHYTIDDILDDGSCPVCGVLHGNWTPYNCPEEEHLGTVCPSCDTHFVDVDNSRVEFEGW